LTFIVEDYDHYGFYLFANRLTINRMIKPKYIRVEEEEEEEAAEEKKC